MPRPRFHDAYHCHNGSYHYHVTNEEPLKHAELLGDQTFAKGGGICSSGEVLFGVLLPRCDEVVVVDHHYTSMASAFAKALMLEKFGPRAMKALMLESTHAALIMAGTEIIADLPDSLRSKLVFSANGDPSWASSYGDLKKEWSLLPDAALDIAATKLDKLTFVHGDLRDLLPFGPFDCFYASNVLGEHYTRDGKCPDLDYVAPLVREDGGLLLVARSCGRKLLSASKNWRPSRILNGDRTDYYYQLYQRQAEELLVDTAAGV